MQIKKQDRPQKIHCKLNIIDGKSLFLPGIAVGENQIEGNPHKEIQQRPDNGKDKAGRSKEGAVQRLIFPHMVPGQKSGQKACGQRNGQTLQEKFPFGFQFDPSFLSLKNREHYSFWARSSRVPK